MGETEVFLSGAGLTPGGVAGTCRVEGGDPNCDDKYTQPSAHLVSTAAKAGILGGSRHEDYYLGNTRMTLQWLPPTWDGLAKKHLSLDARHRLVVSVLLAQSRPWLKPSR